MTLLNPPVVCSDQASANHSLRDPLSARARIASLVGVVLPFLGFAAAIILLWDCGFDWLHGGLMIGMYLLSAIGITVGYHRYFTHRSFQTPRAVQCLLALLGSTALQGSVLKWAAMHRCHHQYSDAPDDPHSPHHHGQGVRGVLRGMWHAHMGWIFSRDPRNLARYIPDLSADRMLRVMSRLWMLWALLGLLVPAILGGVISGSWMGFLLGFLWGGLARIFFVHHVTWSINSVCHLWGTRPFRSHDHSRNNFIFGVLGLGEGWHNNHHAFPSSARHGLRWWEIDMSYWIIRALALTGLVWDVKLPGAARLNAKLSSA